jgi:hypothetical protein
LINIEEEIDRYLRNNVSIIEAATEISRKHNIEIESVALVISNNSRFKAASYKEACDMKMIKDSKKVGKFPKE